MFANILAPTDFSAHADHAVAFAFALAEKCGGKVHLLHAYLPPFLPEGMPMTLGALDSLQNAAEEGLRAAARRYEGRPELGQILFEVADPRSAVLRAGEAIGADLIVMGTHGRRGFRRALLGSVAEAVVRTSRVPVLTVHLPESSAQPNEPTEPRSLER